MSRPATGDKPDRNLADPRLLAFLPMLYVAWADGDLADEEIESICSTVTRALDTEAGCRELLGRWLDPARPPSAPELQSILVNRLCREVRPQALPLVEAFDIPDELLAAPIAL